MHTIPYKERFSFTVSIWKMCQHFKCTVCTGWWYCMIRFCIQSCQILILYFLLKSAFTHTENFLFRLLYKTPLKTLCGHFHVGNFSPSLYASLVTFLTPLPPSSCTLLNMESNQIYMHLCVYCKSCLFKENCEGFKTDHLCIYHFKLLLVYMDSPLDYWIHRGMLCHCHKYTVHCKKSVFPSPAGMSLTKLPLAGNANR